MTAPWQHLVLFRHSAGLTQAQLAKGIVSQSMLAKIERGHVLPSTDTLTRIGQRLDVDPVAWLDTWSHLRHQNQVRELLWEWANGRLAADAVEVLSEYKPSLSAFEWSVYSGYADAVSGDVVLAEQALDAAWLSAVPVCARKYRDYALVVHALGRAKIADAYRQHMTAAYWSTRAEQLRQPTKMVQFK